MSQVIFIELMSEMKEPDDFTKAVTTSTVTMAAAYCLVGSMGFYFIGTSVESPITAGIADGWPKKLCNSMVFVHVVMAYVIEVCRNNTARRLLATVV
jgi:amino acid permease